MPHCHHLRLCAHERRICTLWFAGCLRALRLSAIVLGLQSTAERCPTDPELSADASSRCPSAHNMPATKGKHKHFVGPVLVCCKPVQQAPSVQKNAVGRSHPCQHERGNRRTLHPLTQAAPKVALHSGPLGNGAHGTGARPTWPRSCAAERGGSGHLQWAVAGAMWSNCKAPCSSGAAISARCKLDFACQANACHRSSRSAFSR